MNSFGYSSHLAYIEAVNQNNWDFVLAATKEPTFVNRNPFHWTPLHYAVAYDNVESARKILEIHKDYLNVQDKYRRTPLSIAALKGNSELVKVLLENGANVDIGLPLCYAAKKGNSECVLTLIENGCNVDEIDESEYDSKFTPRYTPLIIAIKENHPDIVQLLINHNANTNFEAHKHLTPLHWACQDGTLEMVKALLTKETELNCRCRHDNTPLEYALLNDKVDIIKYLLEKGSSVNTTGKMRQTALHGAVNCRKFEYVEEIMKYSPDLNIQDIDGATPLYLCTYSGQIDEDIVECLISNGADINISAYNTWTPLHICCAVGNLKCVKLLVEKLSQDGINAVTMDNITPFYVAAANGHTDICRELLEKQAYLNVKLNKFRDLCTAYPSLISDNDFKDGYTAERIATENEHHDVVELIKYYKENHPDKNIETVEIITYTRANMIDEISSYESDIKATDSLGWTCLHYAAELGHYNLTKVCIDKLKNVNVADKYGRTPLAIAAANGNLDILKLLIENGADTNLGSAIFYAIDNNQLECVTCLLDGSADVNIRDRKKRTPLMFAVIKNYFPIVQELLRRGADISLRDEDEETVLHHACKYDSAEVVTALIRGGADLNAQNSCEEIPLFYALVSEDLNIIRVLLENGTDMNIPDHFKQTPLHYIAEYGSVECVEELFKYSPDIRLKDSESCTAFLQSVHNKHTRVLELFLEHGADVSDNFGGGWTLLHICAFDGDAVKAKKLIDSNIDVNSLSTGSVTPLYIAAARGHVDFIKELIMSGCLIDIPISNLTDWRDPPYFTSKLPKLLGSTPLIAAVCKGHLETVKILHLFGASVATTLEENINPLSLAITNSHYEIFDYLIQTGVQLSSLEKERLCKLAKKKPRIKEKIQAL